MLLFELVFSALMVMRQLKAEIKAAFIYLFIFKKVIDAAVSGGGEQSIPSLASRVRCITIAPLSTAMVDRRSRIHTHLYSIIIDLISVSSGTLAIESQQKVADFFCFGGFMN